jgi:predicted nucleotidyltransferase
MPPPPSGTAVLPEPDIGPRAEPHAITPSLGERDAFVATLHEAVQAMERASIDYLVMGGVSSATLGRPRSTHDIDLFVRPDGADGALDALDAAGFDTERTDRHWLYKGFKRGAMVDVIFRSAGDVYLDDEMLQHASTVDLGGCSARVIAPEDLLVIKAIVASEHVPQHWYDALGIVARGDLDWDYLVYRASRHGVRRVTSLLLYAQSNDIAVPPGPVRQLFGMLYEVDGS